MDIDNFENFNDVFDKEINSLLFVQSNFNKKNINVIINRISDIKGKLIVSGIGKSGHIGKKIAATLASTGTESFFVHSTEAFHGDLGMINKNDAVLLLSYSGETDEVLKVLNYCVKNKILCIGISSEKKSSLALNADFHICSKILEEACSLNLAPTSSTTSTLVIGDAIAVSLMRKRRFKEIDFAKYHPGGSLGKRLLLKAEDILIKEKLPIINLSMSIIDVIYEISKSGYGIGLVLDQNKLIGLLTDGDIRRALLNQNNINEINLSEILNNNYKYTFLDSSLVETKQIMVTNKIITLPVMNKKMDFMGLVQYYDM